MLCAQNFSVVDRYARKAPRNISNSIAKLNDYLAPDNYTDIEKVRSFYTWIIHHIDYDQRAYKKGARRINRSNMEILKRKKAICYGYSSLFREMCRLEDIPCEIISGYARQSAEFDLNTINHAWNAVQIDSTWYLLDLTWESARKTTNAEAFFLASPVTFIHSHLPSEPMWQLLPCPVTPEIFAQKTTVLRTYLKDQSPCFSYVDSINLWQKLPQATQYLTSAQWAYAFHPTDENKRLLGQAYLNYASELEIQATALEESDSIAALLVLQKEMMTYYDAAKEYTPFFPHQFQNLAGLHFNYAVALSRNLPSTAAPKKLLREMLEHFEKGKKILEEGPENLITENILTQFSEYIDWTQAQLKE